MTKIDDAYKARIESTRKRITIAAYTQLPGDSAAMIVEEIQKVHTCKFNNDFCIILEVLIEQLIICHRSRYTEPLAFTQGTQAGLGWVTSQLARQSKVICHMPQTWFEAEDEGSHELLLYAVTMLLDRIHLVHYADNTNNLIDVWRNATGQTLNYLQKSTLIGFIIASVQVHILRAMKGEMDASLAFARRSLMFRLKSPLAQHVRDELTNLEVIWGDSITEEKILSPTI